MKYLSLLPFAAAVAIVSTTGAMFQPGEWYQTLVRPAIAPPGWVFGPVWTVIYILIAIAGWLVWRREGVSVVFALWCLQLILNMAWSWIMFERQEIGWALVDILLLWGTIALFIVLAWPANKLAAAFFGVYLAWVSFATLLNYQFWQLNASAS